MRIITEYPIIKNGRVVANSDLYSYAQGDSFKLEGRVIDDSGSPISNAKLVYNGTSIKTNRKGIFKPFMVKEGEYVTISADGYDETPYLLKNNGYKQEFPLPKLKFYSSKPSQTQTTETKKPEEKPKKDILGNILDFFGSIGSEKPKTNTGGKPIQQQQTKQTGISTGFALIGGGVLILGTVIYFITKRK
jgi:hypothetical protein